MHFTGWEFGKNFFSCVSADPMFQDSIQCQRIIHHQTVHLVPPASCWPSGSIISSLRAEGVEDRRRVSQGLPGIQSELSDRELFELPDHDRSYRSFPTDN